MFRTRPNSAVAEFGCRCIGDKTLDPSALKNSAQHSATDSSETEKCITHGFVNSNTKLPDELLSPVYGNFITGLFAEKISEMEDDDIIENELYAPGPDSAMAMASFNEFEWLGQQYKITSAGVTNHLAYANVAPANQDLAHRLAKLIAKNTYHQLNLQDLKYD